MTSERSGEALLSESAGALLGVLGEFWPDGDARVLKRGDPNFGSAGYAFVPNARQARLLIPIDRPRAAAEAMHKFSAALSMREIVGRSAAALAFRIGLASLLPDRVLLPGATPLSLSEYLAQVLGEPVTYTVSVGSARANRKPILQVFSRSGRTIAYAKIGDGPVSAADVSKEAVSLSAVGDRLPANFEIPEKLHFGYWNEVPVLLISPLRVGAGQRPMRWLRIPTQEMIQFSACFAAGESGLVNSPFWTRLLNGTQRLRSRDRRHRLESLCDAISSAAGGIQFSIGAWHGDWTPWNMAISRGRLQLWDWERFETGVPLGLDIVHFAVNAVTRRAGFDVVAIRDALELSEKALPNWDPVVLRLTQASYLAAVALRYSTSAEGPNGDLIAKQADIALEAGAARMHSASLT